MTSFFEQLKSRQDSQNTNEFEKEIPENIPIDEPSLEKKSSFFEQLPERKRIEQEKAANLPVETEPGIWDEMTRLGTQYGSRVLEMILDVPYGAKQAVKGVLTGETPLLPFLPKDIQGKPIGTDSSIFKQMISGSPDDLSGTFPKMGGEELKNRLSSVTDGYTDPKGPWEKRTGEGLQTLASLFLPGSNRFADQPFRNFVRKTATALGAELSKEGVKILGGDEKAQELSKVGPLFLLSLSLPALFGQQSARQFNRQLYEDAYSNLPQGSRTGAGQLRNEIANFRSSNDLQGIQSGIRGQLNTALNDLEGIVQNGTVDVRLLADQRARVNELREKFYREGAITNTQAERRLMGRLMNVIDNTLDAYGSTTNPQFLESFRTATQVAATLQQSNRVSNFFKRHIPFIKSKTPALLLFEGAPSNIKNITKIGLAAATAQGASNMAALQYRIFQSPALREYYMNVVMNALREDAPAMMKSYAKLEDALLKEEKSNRKKNRNP